MFLLPYITKIQGFVSYADVEVHVGFSLPAFKRLGNISQLLLQFLERTFHKNLVFVGPFISYEKSIVPSLLRLKNVCRFLVVLP